MRLTAQEVYNRLVDDDKILELQGQIKFYAGYVMRLDTAFPIIKKYIY